MAATISWGGALSKNTQISTGPYQLILTGSKTGSILSVTNNTHTAIYGQSTGNDGVQGLSINGAGGNFTNRSTVVNTVETALKVTRSITGAPSAGIGGAIEYLISTNQSPHTPQTSNRLISAWTDEFLASRTSDFIITGVDNAVESDLLTLSGSGATRLNKYGVSTFTGTPATYPAFDVNGNLIEVSGIGSGPVITADNGLTKNSATNVQLGGTLLANTTITATARNLTIDGTSSFGVLYAKATTGTALVAEATGTGHAINALVANDVGYAINTFKNTSSTNTVVGVIVAQRTTTGTAGDGIGGSIDFFNEISNGSSNASNKLISKWTTADALTRVSQLIISGVDNAVTADLLTLNGNGSIRFNDYGTGTNTGTATYALATDADGDIIEIAVGGGTYTASNGLTMTANNTVLGGTLTGSTTITGGAFGITVTGTGATNPLSSTTSSGIGLYGQTSSGIGVEGFASSTGLAGYFLVNPSSTNTVATIVSVQRSTSGSAANGIGGSIDFNLETTTTDGRLSARIASTFTDVTDATRTGDLQFFTTNSATSAIKATLAGSGALRLHNYGVNTFTGVVAYNLGVTATGEVIEVAAAGGGMTNPMTTTGDIIYSSSGATPARLGIGTNGQLLRVSAGGIPEWATITGTGSVTDFVFTDANGVDGTVTTSTTVPTLSLAFTPNGMLKSNGTTLSAATSGTDYSAGTSALATGILKSTTTTGALTIAVAGDFPTLNQNTTGSAATLTTSRNINGVAFNGSADITVTAAAGTLTGTTLNATVVTTSITAVGTIATGVWQGTAIGDTYISSASTWNAKQTEDATLTALAGLTITNGSIIYGTGADAFSVLAAGTNGQVLTLAGGVPTWAAEGSGTVTSVAMSVPSFLSVSGSPITGAGTFAVTLSGTALPAANGGTGLTAYGTANQMTGMNAGGTALEYKTLSASNGIVITHSVGGVAYSNVFNPTVQTLTDGATITWNVTNGGNAVVTLAGTGRTLSITNPVAGYTYSIRIIQGSGGSKTITTWPTNTKWPDNGTVIALSASAGEYDKLNLEYDGVNFYASYQKDYN